jgi:Ca2+-binding RTX toxin-like protein
MVGSVLLDGNNDKFFGAKGQLTGTLDGGAGDDELYDGIGGNPINGGEGSDTIAGGAGADIITGGPGEDSSSTDTVIYYKTSDSTPNHFDILTDISTSNGLDAIDLHLIDANTRKAGNQAFHFSSDNTQEIGGLWDKVVHPQSGDAYMMLYGETDGDKQIDFCIKWLHHDHLEPIEIIL